MHSIKIGIKEYKYTKKRYKLYKYTYILLSFTIDYSNLQRFKMLLMSLFLLFIINSIVLLTFLYTKRNIKRGKRGNKAPNTTTTKKGIKRTHPTPRTQNHTFYIVPHPQFCLILSFPSTNCWTTTYTHAHAHTHNG